MTRIAIKQETLEIALVELQECKSVDDNNRGRHQAITAIKQALSAPLQEPVAWMYPDDYERMLTSETFCTVYSVEVGSATRGESSVALYTTPPAQPAIVLQQAYRTSEAYTIGYRDGQAAQPAAPEGWKLVPVEPTKEMWDAVNKLDDQCAGGNYDGKGCSIEQAWDCLLTAAPAQPAPVQPVSGVVLRDGYPTLVQDKHIKENDQRLYATPPAQPAVPDAMTSADIQESIEYVAGWNDCRQAMMEMMK
jgi:hypothetical protein